MGRESSMKRFAARPILTQEMSVSNSSNGHKPHPLVGLDQCWSLLCKKSLDHHRAPWQAWLIRKVYDWCDWSGDFCTEFFGTFTDESVARQIAAQKNLEARRLGTGDVWEVKQSPVNRVLPYEPVIYGTRSYPATTIDDRYRAREPTELMPCRAMQKIGGNLEQANQEIDRTLAMARAASSAI